MGSDIKIQRWSDYQQGPLEISLDEWCEAVAATRQARLAHIDDDQSEADLLFPVRFGDVEVKVNGEWKHAIHWIDYGQDKGTAFFSVDSLAEWGFHNVFFKAVVEICNRLGASLVTEDMRVIDPETLEFCGYAGYTTPGVNNNLVHSVYQLIQSLTVEGFDQEAEKIRSAVVPLASECDIAETIRPILYNMYELPISDDTRQYFYNIFKEMNCVGGRGE